MVKMESEIVRSPRRINAAGRSHWRSYIFAVGFISDRPNASFEAATFGLAGYEKSGERPAGGGGERGPEGSRGGVLLALRRLVPFLSFGRGRGHYL